MTESIQAKINEANARIGEIESILDTPADHFDIHDLYDETLGEDNNELHHTVLRGYSIADILKNCDETAYRCGYEDFCDGYDWECHSGILELQDEREELLELVGELESEL